MKKNCIVILVFLCVINVLQAMENPNKPSDEYKQLAGLLSQLHKSHVSPSTSSVSQDNSLFTNPYFSASSKPNNSTYSLLDVDEYAAQTSHFLLSDEGSSELLSSCDTHQQSHNHKDMLSTEKTVSRKRKMRSYEDDQIIFVSSDDDDSFSIEEHEVSWYEKEYQDIFANHGKNTKPTVQQFKEKNRCLHCSKNIHGRRVNAHKLWHEKKGFPCNECEIAFKSKHDHEKHYKGVHEKSDEKKCLQCEYWSINKQNFENHISKPHETQICKVCQQQLGSKGALKQHYVKEHPEKNGAFCERCGYVTENPAMIRRHGKTNHSIPLMCIKHKAGDPSCKGYYMSIGALQQHYKQSK